MGRTPTCVTPGGTMVLICWCCYLCPRSIVVAAAHLRHAAEHVRCQIMRGSEMSRSQGFIATLLIAASISGCARSHSGNDQGEPENAVPVKIRAGEPGMDLSSASAVGTGALPHGES